VEPLQPRVRGLPGNTASPNAGAPKQIRRQGSLSPEKKPPPAGILQQAMRSTDASSVERMVAAAAIAINLRDFAELRSFRQPPPVVCRVLDAIAVLLGIADMRWAKMRKLLDSALINKICAFDPSRLSSSQVEQFGALLQDPTFSSGSLDERCPAIAPLAEWCKALGAYIAAFPPAGPAPAEAEEERRSDVVRDTARVAQDIPLRGGVISQSFAPRPELGGLIVDPDLWVLNDDELAHVHELCVRREGVGSVTFHGEMDCRDILEQLTQAVVLNPGEVVVYPDQGMKPPAGQGLNRPASIVLYGCLPKAQTFRDRTARERYKKRVRHMTESKGAEFIDYDCDQGIWEFRVAHF